MKSKKKLKKVRLRQTLIAEPTQHYLEEPVRFSFAKCKAGGKYCIAGLNKEYLYRLYKTFGKLENLTWRQFQQRPREQSITPEKKNSQSLNDLIIAFPGLSNFGHFRVDGLGTPFRVFVSSTNKLLYVLWFDRSGKLHH